MSATTFRTNFGGFWRSWRDAKVMRDMEFVKRIHPGTLSLDQWMREVGYDGSMRIGLKNMEDQTMSSVALDPGKLVSL